MFSAGLCVLLCVAVCFVVSLSLPPLPFFLLPMRRIGGKKKAEGGERGGLQSKQLNELKNVVEEHKDEIIKTWRKHFSN